VSGSYEPIRSYQRIFRPERRIYQIEGRTLPVPGGVPLRWLAYATATLLFVIAVGSGSAAVTVAAAAVAAATGLNVGGRAAAGLAALGAAGLTVVGGWALGLLDWPLRLIVIPATVATLATQATPDGRRADRFALSWLSLRLAPMRRSLGRSLPLPGVGQRLDGELWVKPDERQPLLRRGKVSGPAVVFFAIAVVVRRSGLRRRRLQVVPAGRARRTEEVASARLVLADGETLEVRP
jgi:hypothetical protein